MWRWRTKHLLPNPFHLLTLLSCPVSSIHLFFIDLTFCFYLILTGNFWFLDLMDQFLGFWVFFLFSVLGFFWRKYQGVQFDRSECGFSSKIIQCRVYLAFLGVYSDLKEIASLIETGAYAREVRRISRAVRLTMVLRKKLKASSLGAFLNYVLVPGSDVHSRLSSFLPKVIF